MKTWGESQKSGVQPFRKHFKDLAAVISKLPVSNSFSHYYICIISSSTSPSGDFSTDGIVIYVPEIISSLTQTVSTHIRLKYYTRSTLYALAEFVILLKKMIKN